MTHLDWDDSREDPTWEHKFDEALADADALIAAPWVGVGRKLPPFTAQRWAKASQLKVIAGTFDNRFDGWLSIPEAAERGVAVLDTSRSMTPIVAEFALAMTLNLLRDIPAAVQLVREGRWRGASDTWDPPGGITGDLTGRRVGLAGFGTINQRYAQLVAPFECSVRACDPFVPAPQMLERGVEPVETLAELASRSEIFVIGIPPTPSTQGVVDRETIDALPRAGLVVLVTRMAVVDQAALWRRAEAGEIRVAVDVFDPEPPPPDAWFRTSPQVLPTPHVASNTFHGHRRCFTTACRETLAALAGEAPRFRVSIRDDLIYRGKKKR